MKNFVTILFLLLSLAATGQTRKPNPTEILKECLQVAEDGANRQQAIWYPTVFWQQIGEQLKMDPKVVQIIVDELDSYMLFAIVDYRLLNGGASFRPEAEILSTLAFNDSNDRTLKPVSRAALSEGARSLLQAMKPVLAKVFGQFGDGMVLVFFKSPAPGSGTVYDPVKPNQFGLRWGTTMLNWTLPLASAMPAKSCPVDGAAMNGNWNYCPFHGRKL